MTRLKQDKVDQLLTRCQREVDEGLLPSCQVALGIHSDHASDRIDAPIVRMDFGAEGVVDDVTIGYDAIGCDKEAAAPREFLSA